MPEHADIEVRRDVAAMSDADLKKLYSIAAALALSKRFPDARTADEAYAKVLLGADLGLSPTQAMTGLHIVEGRPQIAAVTLAGFVRKSDVYDYKVTEITDTKCSIQFLRHGEPEGVSEFTIEKARTAGLVKPNSNWVKWPENMLFARAMSNGVKRYCPDLMGGVPIYTEADTFEGTATELTSGEGDGGSVGWRGLSVDRARDLEEILKLAGERGHAGLASRPTMEMNVNGQPEGVVQEYIDRARTILSALVPKPVVSDEDADVILDLAESIEVDAVQVNLEARRDNLLDDISEAEGMDNESAVIRLRDELEVVEAQIAAAQNAEQGHLDV